MEEMTKGLDGSISKKNEIEEGLNRPNPGVTQAKEEDTSSDAMSAETPPLAVGQGNEAPNTKEVGEETGDRIAIGDSITSGHDSSDHKEEPIPEKAASPDPASEKTSGFIEDRATGTDGYLTVPWMASFLGPNWVAELTRDGNEGGEQYLMFTGTHGVLKLYPDPKNVQGTLLDKMQKLRLIRRRS